jgi:hypothetical protein
MDATARWRRDRLRQARSAAEAVQIAASFAGLRDVGEWVARQLAEAAVGFSDSAVSVREAAPRELWEIEGFRDQLRRKMRWNLLDLVTSQGLVPVTLPAEAISYRAWGFTADEAAGSGEVPESANWTTVLVMMSVRVRIPPVDREAAVKAGLLKGD